MKRVTIEWNTNFFEERTEGSHFAEEDVTIHDNGWVTIQVQNNVIIHYSPSVITRIIITEGTGL